VHGQVTDEYDTNYGNIRIFLFQEVQTLLASRKKRKSSFVIKMLPTIPSTSTKAK
jgi:hypothetical protein